MPMHRPLTRDSLIEAFHTYGRPRDSWLAGAEFERHLLGADGMPLPWDGKPGVRWLLERLAEVHGWDLVLEGRIPIALTRGRASVTLEPGGQFELSGTPFRAAVDVWKEAASFTRDVAALLEPFGASQLALGYTPLAPLDQIGWIPKRRYTVMREHLGRTGALAHHMMKGTCAVQASFDFADEPDCIRKVRLATGLGPLTTAMFANSPLMEGAPTGFQSFRGHIWTKTDPRRTGLPDAAADFSFERWVDYLLDVPMMFTRDADGAYRPAHGRTFRSWMADGTDGPTVEDWDLHQTSVFPEVRVKQQIEVRGADCVPLPLAMAFVVLFKGLFYCKQATDHATELAARFATHGDRSSRFEAACRDGLHAQIGGKRLSSWAEELLELSDSALERCAPEDRGWLRPLFEQVESGECPARRLTRELEASPGYGTILQHGAIGASWRPASS